MPAQDVGIFLARADKTKKDIIISASGIQRNAATMSQIVLPNGVPHSPMVTNYLTQKDYDFLADFRSMTAEQQKKMLDGKYTVINVHLQEMLSYKAAEKHKTVIGKINQLGVPFFQHATDLFLNLDFPDFVEGNLRLRSNDTASKALVSFRTRIHLSH